jgi:CRP-like cAMP-binding protein
MRHRAYGLSAGNRFDFNVTQSELSDILGLSLVHTNRTVQELRSTGLVRWDGREVEITNLERLAEVGDFDGTYLNLWSEPR